jgi:hypothetical protein
MLEDLKPHTRQFPCKVRTVLDSLEPKDVAILTEALANTALWPHKTLSNALKNKGITIVDSGISRHREGRCSC